jgi:hypothetical protein
VQGAVCGHNRLAMAARRTPLLLLRARHAAPQRRRLLSGSSRDGRGCLAIVDMTPLAYRAHFGYSGKQVLSRSPGSGVDTTAISGAIRLLLDLIDGLGTERVAVVFDGPDSWVSRQRRIDAASALGRATAAAAQRAAAQQAEQRAGLERCKALLDAVADDAGQQLIQAREAAAEVVAVATAARAAVPTYGSGLLDELAAAVAADDGEGGAEQLAFLGESVASATALIEAAPTRPTRTLEVVLQPPPPLPQQQQLGVPKEATAQDLGPAVEEGLEQLVVAEAAVSATAAWSTALAKFPPYLLVWYSGAKLRISYDLLTYVDWDYRREQTHVTDDRHQIIHSVVGGLTLRV